VTKAQESPRNSKERERERGRGEDSGDYFSAFHSDPRPMEQYTSRESALFFLVKWRDSARIFRVNVISGLRLRTMAPHVLGQLSSKFYDTLTTASRGDSPCSEPTRDTLTMTKNDYVDNDYFGIKCNIVCETISITVRFQKRLVITPHRRKNFLLNVKRRGLQCACEKH